ncbi:DNA mismatch endonuclease Vsr [Mesorhizobium sp. B4-1-3]|uniref:very short patch repair endonuclease n=1 Tax=Mesorhizobium sp. B4-1-3 TaxID=2589889 RepID=UPI001125BAE4|nr:very short patch repair endonuclease [Mesorhizobium sp. B4-1-3]TPI09918.1 DNA mismatch endonuclease Vsr [Mesorhizobium sp. B4-1-3]
MPDQSKVATRPDFQNVSAARRRNMAAIKARNTRPELQVRQLLHRLGYRFRLHKRDLPGRPDIVLPGRRAAIFVHGCFWHGHGCRNSVLPRTRADWWEAKLNRTAERDGQNIEALTTLGWKVLVLWECMLGDEAALEASVKEALGPPRLARRHECAN